MERADKKISVMNKLCVHSFFLLQIFKGEKEINRLNSECIIRYVLSLEFASIK